MQRKSNIYVLAEGAILIALAQILSLIKLWEMPWGGSVTLAMVPLILFAVRRGVKPGLEACLAFGILQFIFDGGIAIGWQSIIGDYLVAFTVLGFAGLVSGKKGAIFTGTLIAGLARFLVHFVVGATIWASYMPEEFLGLPMSSPWFYSFLYNILYMGPNIILTIIVFALVCKPLGKYFTAQ